MRSLDQAQFEQPGQTVVDDDDYQVRAHDSILVPSLSTCQRPIRTCNNVLIVAIKTKHTIRAGSLGSNLDQKNSPP